MITPYEPAPQLDDERQRERAVEASGALAMRDHPGLQAIVEDVRRDFGMASAAVSIVHSDWQYMVAAAGVAPGPSSRRLSFCGHAIEHPTEVFCVPDATQDPRFAGNPVVAEGGLRFYAAAPLVGADRQALGTLCVFDDAPRPMLAPADVRRLADAAARAMALIEARQGTGDGAGTAAVARMQSAAG